MNGASGKHGENAIFEILYYKIMFVGNSLRDVTASLKTPVGQVILRALLRRAKTSREKLADFSNISLSTKCRLSEVLSKNKLTTFYSQSNFL